MKKSVTRLLATVVMMLSCFGMAFADAAISLGDVTTLSPEKNAYYADQNNHVTGVTVTVPVTNSGDVDLTPGTAGYSLSVADYSTNDVLQTVEIDEAIAVGETKNITFDLDISLDGFMANAANDALSVYKRLYIKENLGDSKTTFGSAFWRDYYFYKVAYNIVEEDSNTTLTELNYGIVSEEWTMTLRIRCTGAAPLTLTDIVLPAGFSTELVTPVTITTDQYITVDIDFDPAKTDGGAISDVATFKFDGADDATVSLVAVALSADSFLEEFDSLPESWIFSPATSWSASNGYLARSLQDPAWAITPRLSFNGKESLSFDASIPSTSNSNVLVEVYYSTDRTNWTLIKGINKNGDSGYDKFPTSANKFQSYVTNVIPAGDYYIGFKMQYSNIDNVCGGKLATVDHDIFITGFTTPSKAVVGSEATATIVAKNLGNNDESAYTVTLYNGDTQIATAAATEWTAGSEKSFDLTFTPAEIGTLQLRAEIAIGSYVVATETKTIPVVMETAAFVKVGKPSATTVDVPINFNYKRSEAQVLITADELAAYGVKPGTVVTAIAIDGYMTGGTSKNGHHSVSFVSTDATSITEPVDLTSAHVAFDAPEYYYEQVKKGDANNLTEVQVYEFNNPYTYTGGNIVVDILSDREWYSGRLYGETASSNGKYVYRQTDGTSLSSATWNTKATFPVLKFGVSSVPATLSGVVTDYAGNTVAGATVTITSGDLSYTATTAADGSYSINVFRDDLEYTLEATATDLPSATATVSFANPTQVLNIQLINQEPALALGAYTTTPGSGNIYANSENKVTGVSTTITISNAGAVAFTPGDTNYSISLYDNNDILLQTVDIDQTLGVGQSIDFTFDWNFSLNEIMDKEKGICSWNRITAKDNISDNSVIITGDSSTPWRYFYFYTVAGDVIGESSPSHVSALEYGFVTEAVTKTVRVSSEGAAPLVVTSIDFPAGFSTDTEFPLTVAGGEKQNVNITFTPSTPGAIAGNAVFHFDGIDDITVALSASYVGPNSFLETFEHDGDLPENWVFSPNTNWKAYYNNRGEDNKYELHHTTSSSKAWAITPKLHFNEGEALTFEAAKGAYASEIGCFYSSDRVNWTLLKGYTGGANSSYTSLPSSSHSYTNCAVTLPEGDWYIGFEMSYAYIDNVFGGELAAVDHDIFINATNQPAKATVNHLYTMSLTATNMDGAETADDYTVDLFVNDTKVKSIEGEDWASNETKTFTIGYTPNVDGTDEVYAVISFDGYSVATPVTTVEVAPESSDKAVVVGDPNNSNSMSPIYFNYMQSQSQILYTEELLAQYGITPGDKITSISYDGYKTAAYTGVGSMAVAIKSVDNTSLSTSEAIDMSDATTVYNNSNETFSFPESSYTNHDTMLALTFDAPYVYTGGNIVVELLTVRSWYTQVFGETDNNVSGCSINRYIDNGNLSSKSWSTIPFPVIKFGVAGDVYTISGTITDAASSNPVAGATVTIKAGDVKYTTVSDEDGNYSMQVYQPQHEYALEITHDNYNTHNEEGINFDGGDVVKHAALTSNSSTGIGAAYADGRHSVKVVGGNIVVNAACAADVVVYNASGVTVNRKSVNAGRTLIPATKGIYIVTVGHSSFKVSVR